MKKILLTLLFATGFCVGAVCQNSFDFLNNTHRVTKLQDDSTHVVLEFTSDSVLVMSGTFNSLDPEIKHGEFTFYNIDGRKQAVGDYYDNQLSGTWKIFDKSGSIIRTLNYEVAHEYLKKKITLDNDFVIRVDNMPEFEGENMSSFNDYIDKNLFYPIYNQRRKIEAIIYVNFVVNPDGYINKVEILKSDRNDFDMEVIRVLLESPQWKPGIQDNRNTEVQLSFPIKFKVKKKQDKRNQDKRIK